MSDTKQRVESVIEAQSNCAGDSLSEYDWIDWIQLACELEEEFEVPVSDEALERCKSVESICEYIESLLVEV